MGTFALQTILAQKTAGFCQITLITPPTKSENTVVKKNPQQEHRHSDSPKP
jgi:hypothetical protein